MREQVIDLSTRLTTGRIEDVSWNPDGTKLAFRWLISTNSEYVSDIYTVEVQEENGELVVVNMTNLSAIAGTTGVQDREDDPVWSPDGDKIAFSSKKQGYAVKAVGGCTTYPTNGNRKIWTMDTNGQNMMLIYGRESRDATEPAWSPDGQKIAYRDGSSISVAQNRPLDCTAVAANKVFQDRPGYADGMSYLSRQPSWSADGENIVYQRSVATCCPEAGPYELWTMKADGTGPEQMTTGGYNSKEPSWQAVVIEPPSVEKIAYLSNVEGPGYQLYTADPEGTNARKLTNEPFGLQSDSRPSLSPNGKLVAYVVNTSADGWFGDIYVRRTDSSPDWGSRRLISNAHHPVWSPDGTRLAYLTGYGSVNRALYVYGWPSPNSSIRLTSATYMDSPSWSPDGHKIAFARHYMGSDLGYQTLQKEIFTVRADAYPFTLQRITFSPAVEEFRPQWSLNGQQQRIAFSAKTGTGACGPGCNVSYNNYDLWVLESLEAAYPTARQITNLVATAPNFPPPSPSWSLDGTEIVFEMKPQSGTGSTTDLYTMVVPASGYGSASLVADLMGSEVVPAWGMGR
jgi:Tol biopolymer transport system component